MENYFDKLTIGSNNLTPKFYKGSRRDSNNFFIYSGLSVLLIKHYYINKEPAKTYKLSV